MQQENEIILANEIKALVICAAYSSMANGNERNKSGLGRGEPICGHSEGN